MSTSPSSAKRIFLDALELEGSEREAWLREACGADVRLLGRVRELLAAHARVRGELPDGLLEVLPAAPEASPATGMLRAGARIGPFTLLRELGEGGFGSVWVATQEVPMRRTVALKVLKPTLASLQVVRRFEEERSVLARMQDEGIATLYEGGTTPEGLSWFAMELVDGAPITEHCRARDLPLRARLELFARVCRAVQHAHQKGVVHRDVKPSNVLVAEVDGRAVPKVIDFGIAKLFGAGAAERTLETRTGFVLGTPAYISPEQIDDASDVDTRADVYSLGVLLYELCSDARPLDEATLKSSSLSEVLRLIREVDPARPSARLAEQAQQASGAERARLRARQRQVAGDLDWITMRCLEKDRERRYDSVALLGGEIERHLRAEPVLAGPPRVAYRVAKFARRHRAALAGLAALLLILVAATVVSATQAVRASRAEAAAHDEALLARDAEERAREEARRAREAEQAAGAEAARARRELTKFEEIALFLQDVLLSIDPAVAQGRDRTLLREVLDRAARRIERGAWEVPEVEAELRHTIGQAYFALALLESAEPQLRRALELREAALGPGHPDTLTVANDLGGLLLRTNRLTEGEQLVARVYRARTRLLGPQDADTLIAFSNLAQATRLRGDLTQAESMLRELLEVRERVGGTDEDDVITSMNNLASVLEEQGRLDEALELYERALEGQERVNGPRHPHTLTALNNVGFLLQQAGRLEEAEPYFVRTIEAKRAVLGPDHPSLVISLNNLAELYDDLGRPQQAEAAFVEAVGMARGRLPQDDERRLGVVWNYGAFLLAAGRPREAEPFLIEAEQGWHRAFGPADGRWASARQALDRARELLEAAGEDGPPRSP